jgi:hypothetical protein
MPELLVWEGEVELGLGEVVLPDPQPLARRDLEVGGVRSLV